MKTFNNHLKELLKDKKNKKIYEAEKQLIQIAVQITKLRLSMNLSQKELAKKANITQQQLSKIENGFNCNAITLLKVMNALNLKFKSKKVA